MRDVRILVVVVLESAALAILMVGGAVLLFDAGRRDGLQVLGLNLVAFEALLFAMVAVGAWIARR